MRKVECFAFICKFFSVFMIAYPHAGKLYWVFVCSGGKLLKRILKQFDESFFIMDCKDVDFYIVKRKI